MTIRTTLEDAQTNFDKLIDEVSNGEEVEVTRDGRVVARLVSPLQNAAGLKGLHAGQAKSVADDNQLMSTGERWNAQLPD